MYVIRNWKPIQQTGGEEDVCEMGGDLTASKVSSV